MIQFYSPKDAYGEFSNFSRHPVELDGVVWPTSEHAFQALKFVGQPAAMDRIRLAPSPAKAAEFGRDRSLPLRPDWEIDPRWTGAPQVIPNVPQAFDFERQGIPTEPVFARTKDLVMYNVVLAKFSQNADCQRVLLGTGDAVLVEDALHDPYWGWGASRSGLNKLGRILMMVRTVI